MGTQKRKGPSLPWQHSGMAAANAAQLRVMSHMGHMNFSDLMNHTAYGRNGSAYRVINRSTTLVQGQPGLHDFRADWDPGRSWTNPSGLTEFTAKMRCHAKKTREKLRVHNPSGYGLDEWCQD